VGGVDLLFMRGGGGKGIASQKSTINAFHNYWGDYLSGGGGGGIADIVGSGREMWLVLKQGVFVRKGRITLRSRKNDDA